MTTAPRDTAASPGDPAMIGDDATPVGRGLVRFAVWSAFAAYLLSVIFRPLSAFFLHRQDRWLLLVGAVLMALACYKVPERSRLPVLRSRSWLIFAAVLIIITYLGHGLILADYDLTRDEQMASFDAAVFAQGHLVQRIPTFWRDHADALNTLFMYPAEHRSAWISAYLPFNAALRALLGLVATPYLAGPLMTALGAIALWGCVRRLWPDDREAGFVAMVLYGGSAQILMTGMTSYAMPAHLALDLSWLWLFLRRSRVADLAALAVGFVATGLHQPLMHPMVIAPFLLLLLVERRWDRAALYFVGYAVIGAFWLWWPNWVWSLVQASPDAPRPEGVDYLTRLTTTIRDQSPFGLLNMAANLLRFIAWQHLLLVPLMLIGARLARGNRMVAALAGGLVLTTVVMTVILPIQGLGFGYRYLHGLIGNGILLAIYGWKSLGPRQAQWRTLLLRTTAAGLIVLLPLQAWMAHEIYALSARMSRAIDATSADYAVIGIDDAPGSSDFSYNPPTLDRRPLRLVRGELDGQLITAICANHPSIALIGNKVMAPLNAYYEVDRKGADAANAVLAPRLAGAGCHVRQVD